MNRSIRSWLACLTLPFALAIPQAFAYTHPGISHTAEELATIKASLDKEPWKSGYAKLAADRYSQLTYTMQGPFATVTRNPDLNRWVWMSDMEAVYNLALMWYFTGDSAYAQKSRDILIAWATTQTSMGGQESGLMLGDFAYCYAGGASILRGTWPGWTAADTTTVKNYFLNVLWPGTSAGTYVAGPGSKGLLNLQAGIAIAAFCDDTAKFNHVIDQYRTYPAAGLANALAIGEMGETGRDAGHLQAGLLGMAFISEVAWKQGIDLYSESDNLLLACGEYYARNTLALDNPFVPYGTVDATYYANVAGPYTANRAVFNLLQNAYRNRKNIPTPWIDRKLQQQNVTTHNFLYARTADFSTATPQAAVVRPAVSLASSGLTLTTLGNNSAGRSSSYSNGVWTVTGAGIDVWNDANDDCQFAYQAMTGDCAMVAKVTSVQAVNNSTKVGLMIRDNLSATVSQRAWISITPKTTGTNMVECRQAGWTEGWGGAYFAQRSTSLPPGMPYWLKVERRGKQITTYSSQDGTSWAATVSAYYANLPSTVYIGLFTVSGSATTTTTATFANVAFTGGSGGLVTTPAAPAAVFANGSTKAITVRWLPSFGATAYDLLRSTTSGSGYTALASNLSTATTSYVDTTAAVGTTYYYVARAKNSAGTSGNSPEFYGSRLPSPMASLAFSGTASAHADNAANGEGAAQAFDTDPGSKWFNNTAGATGWLQWDFGANNAQVVKRYTITSANDAPGRDPKNWTFLGSQDASTWTTLDTQSGQTFANRWQQNTYSIGNTTAYRYYRLNITANNGDASSVQLSELGLWGDTGRTIPDGRYVVVSRKSNKVITALNGGTVNGTKFVQWGYNGGDEQKLDFTHLGNGQYKVTGVASGRVMDVSGISTANGAQIHLWDWLNANNQKWTVTPAGDGSLKLTAVHSGKVADVSGGSTADGAIVHQWSYLNGDNQEWRMSATAP